MLLGGTAALAGAKGATDKELVGHQMDTIWRLT
jgi:hypothetical protein